MTATAIPMDTLDVVAFGIPTDTGRGGAAGGVDLKQKAINKARSALYDALMKDPDCLGFLSGRGANPLGILSTISINHAFNGPIEFGAITDTTTNLLSLVPSSATITVNDNGWFFPGLRHPDGTTTGTSLDQGSILLHELGHATGVLLGDNVPDGKKAQQAQDINASVLRQKCQRTLASLKN